MNITRRNCPICLELCLVKSIELPCNHQYHLECLKKQILNKNERCAECRKQYQFVIKDENIEIIENRIIVQIIYMIYIYIMYIIGLFYFISFILFIIISFIISPFFGLIWICRHHKIPSYIKNTTDTNEKISFHGYAVLLSYFIVIMIFLICPRLVIVLKKIFQRKNNVKLLIDNHL